MHVKKKGYVLINSVVLTFFITFILILGAKISNMNITYIKNYEIYSSFLDLKDYQSDILNICNNWLEKNSSKVIKNINSNASDIENVYSIPNENYIKLQYLKDKKIFKIGYGMKVEENHLYCLYRIESKVIEDDKGNILKENKGFYEKVNVENEIIKVFPKRKV